MKRTRGVVLSLVLFTGSVIACQGGGTNEQAPRTGQTQPSAPAADSPGTTFEQKREAFVRTMRARVAELDADIERLKKDAAVRSRDLSAEGKAALDDAIAQLEKRRAETGELIQRARASTSERWEEVTGSTRQAVKRVEDAVADAWRRLRN